MILSAMLRHPRSALVGIGAALRAPAWVSEPKLRSALTAEPGDRLSSRDPDPSLEMALRVANGAVRHLARTNTAWRNTCLYRSMAQYLALRDFGRSAAIRIGVNGAPDHSEERDVIAHSWVVYNGPETVQDGGESWQELRFRA